MKVLVVGANNSGKGTLVRLLGEKTGLETIGCSSVLKQKGLDIATGKLLPDLVVNHVIGEHLKGKNDFILDGYPRTISQDSYMQDVIFEPDLIVVLNVSEDEVLERAVGRRICESCGDSYNLNGFKVPKVDGKCDSCGGNLYQRDDDKEEVVKARYNEYIEQTYPVVTKYKTFKGKTVVWEFDTSETTAEIAEKVAEYIQYQIN